MSLKELTKYLNNPLNLKRLSLAKIQELIQSYPSYPALYHLLAEKTVDLPETERKEIILNIATHTPNRALLYQQLFGKQGLDREVRALLRKANTSKESPSKKPAQTSKPEKLQKEASKTSDNTKDIPVKKAVPTNPMKNNEAENVSSFASWLSGMSMNTIAPAKPKAPNNNIQQTSAPIAPIEDKDPTKTAKKPTPKKHPKESSKAKATKEKRPSKKTKKTKKKDKVQNIIDQSVIEGSETISETLAMLLARQGYYDKAIRMYEKLSLNNPQKSALFAEQIEKIRNKKK